MATVQVRYIVNDVDAAIAFYCGHLGFKEVMHPAPAFAMLTRGDLRLVLRAATPPAGGGQPMPDGTQQQPGGWNRFAIEVEDLAATVEELRKPEHGFAMRSSPESAASRSWWRIRRGILLNCSSRCDRKPG